MTLPVAKRHLNDTQGGSGGTTVGSKRYVYPDGVVFHTSGGAFTPTSSVSAPTLLRQDSRKSRSKVNSDSSLNAAKHRVCSFNLKTIITRNVDIFFSNFLCSLQSVASEHNYHPHHHHHRHHNNGAICDSSAVINGTTREVKEHKVDDEPLTPSHRHSTLSSTRAPPRSILSQSPSTMPSAHRTNGYDSPDKKG